MLEKMPRRGDKGTGGFSATVENGDDAAAACPGLPGLPSCLLRLWRNHRSRNYILATDKGEMALPTNGPGLVQPAEWTQLSDGKILRGGIVGQ